MQTDFGEAEQYSCPSQVCENPDFIPPSAAAMLMDEVL